MEWDHVIFPKRLLIVIVDNGHTVVYCGLVFQSLLPRPLPLLCHYLYHGGEYDFVSHAQSFQFKSTKSWVLWADTVVQDFS